MSPRYRFIRRRERVDADGLRCNSSRRPSRRSKLASQHRAISLEPGIRLSKRLPLETAGSPLSILTDCDQSRSFQGFQVLRNRGLTHRKRLRELRHRRFAADEASQNGAPRRIGEREKCSVETV